MHMFTFSKWMGKLVVGLFRSFADDGGDKPESDGGWIS